MPKKKLISSFPPLILASGLFIIGTNLINTVSSAKEDVFNKKIEGNFERSLLLAGYSCACCRNPNPGKAKTFGKAIIKKGYQEATINVKSDYQPETLEVKADFPLKLTFAQGTSSCDSLIILPFTNLKIDVTSGPQTVDLPGLNTGTYNYSC